MQRSALASRLLIPVLFASLPFAAVAQQGIFNASQAQSGRAIYAQNCSACHGVNFEGSGDAPALSGGTFMLKWRGKMVSELFGEILQNMPPTNPGSLGEAAALSATAYILQRNGAQPGAQALTPGSTTVIGVDCHGPGARDETGRLVEGAGGAARVEVRWCWARRRRQDRQAGAPSRHARRHRPGRSEELRPGDGRDAAGIRPPEDWLIFGRNYQRHSYSPLNQITRDNVKNLQLKWTWAMNDSGANQTTPIVHNGIIYLASPSNIVQALDAQDRRSDLGNARRSGSGAGLRRHSQHRHRRRQSAFCPPATRIWSRSTPATERFSGTRRHPTNRTSPPAATSSSATKC